METTPVTLLLQENGKSQQMSDNEAFRSSISPRVHNQPRTHLPRQDPEGIDITGRRGSCVDRTEALVVNRNQIRGGAVEIFVMSIPGIPDGRAPPRLPR